MLEPNEMSKLKLKIFETFSAYNLQQYNNTNNKNKITLSEQLITISNATIFTVLVFVQRDVVI